MCSCTLQYWVWLWWQNNIDGEEKRAVSKGHLWPSAGCRRPPRYHRGGSMRELIDNSIWVTSCNKADYHFYQYQNIVTSMAKETRVVTNIAPIDYSYSSQLLKYDPPTTYRDVSLALHGFPPPPSYEWNILVYSAKHLLSKEINKEPWKRLLVVVDPRFGFKDPRWIGAWWLGFLVFGTTCAVWSVSFFFLFPKHLNTPEEGITEEGPVKKTKKKTSDRMKGISTF